MCPTVIDLVAVTPPLSVYVIVTVPGLIPVTTPLLLMVALFMSLEDQGL